MGETKIIWFTGQPGSGKTTLARALASELRRRGHTVLELDGEELRRQTGNADYSHAGRVLNVKAGQRRAAQLAVDGSVIIAAFVSPHRKLREEFKRRKDVLEIYLHTSKPSTKDIFRVPDYEPPLGRCLDLDTGILAIEQCIGAILEKFQNRENREPGERPEMINGA